jgi:hypothetical protein
MATIIGEGLRKAAISPDEPTARYTPVSVARGTASAAGQPGPIGAPAVRTVVELWHNVGGMIQRALLGGEFVVGGITGVPAGLVAFTATIGGPFDTAAPASCASALGRALIAGLPAEFGESVLSGLQTATTQLPVGVLIIDRAGYDAVGSSKRAFRLSAGLLVDVLAAQLQGQNPQPRVEVALRSW